MLINVSDSEYDATCEQEFQILLVTQLIFVFDFLIVV